MFLCTMMHKAIMHKAIMYKVVDPLAPATEFGQHRHPYSNLAPIKSDFPGGASQGVQAPQPPMLYTSLSFRNSHPVVLYFFHSINFLNLLQSNLMLPVVAFLIFLILKPSIPCYLLHPLNPAKQIKVLV